MSNASANSSKTSMKKDVKENNEKVEYEILAGFNIICADKNKEKLKMDEEYSKDCSNIPMFEFASKEVGTHTIGKDSKGNTVRVDEKTGTKYVTGKDGKTKVVRRPKEKEQEI